MIKNNIVAIDPSLISTALVVGVGDDYKIFNYCRESKVMGKKGMTKWFKLAEEMVTYRFIDYREFGDYSSGELIKLNDYDRITDSIISDIAQQIDHALETKIIIEGYSFSSGAGDIIDLVTFSTLLRKKLYDSISRDILVISPATLKLESCKLTYTGINIGIKKEKIVWKNNSGISGGSFTKHDMFMSIVENSAINCHWGKFCRVMKTDIMQSSKVPKPFEDIIDSFLLYKILEKKMDN
jgi:hypothetical protein